MARCIEIFCFFFFLPFFFHFGWIFCWTWQFITLIDFTNAPDQSSKKRAKCPLRASRSRDGPDEWANYQCGPVGLISLMSQCSLDAMQRLWIELQQERFIPSLCQTRRKPVSSRLRAIIHWLWLFIYLPMNRILLNKYPLHSSQKDILYRILFSFQMDNLRW